MKSLRFIREVTALALVLSLFAGVLLIGTSQANALPGTDTSPLDKVSPDLRNLINQGYGTTPVTAIIQSNGPWSNLQDTILQLYGALVTKVFNNLNARLVQLPANSADALASYQSISYISLDNDVKSAGHITNTTGAQQSRAQKTVLGTSYTLDGSGMAIAVLDSGIDTTHKSFSGSLGRLIISKDFTGENRTDDPFGHGTHVAAIAAGDGTATNGAYEGIAPKANLRSEERRVGKECRTRWAAAQGERKCEKA